MGEALDVIEKSINMLGPIQKSSKAVNNAKRILPAPPDVNLILGPHTVAHFRSGELIGSVMQSIDFTEEKKTACLIPDLPPLSGKSLKLTAKDQHVTFHARNFNTNVGQIAT